MRGFLAVARREIEEKRFVFAAAAVASLIPFAVTLVRGLHGTAATEARDWTTAILAGAFLLGLGVILGGSVISRDLVDRRIGFYFSRPLSALSIWGGKILGSWFLIAGATALILSPTWLAGGFHFSARDNSPEATAGIALLAILLVPSFHAASIAVRSRLVLLVLDVVCLLFASLVLYLVHRRLMSAYAAEALNRGGNVFAALLTAGVFAAGYAALACGRTDIRAAHRALSTTLWAIVGAGVLAFVGYASWVLSASPRALTAVDSALPATRGSWIMVEGPARGGLPAFLLDTATGRYERAGADWRWPILSPDGSRAAWFEPSASGGPMEVLTLKLDDPRSKPVRTGLFLTGNPALAFLSEHGESFATISGGLLSVRDLTTGASLGSARVAGEQGYPRGFFLDRNRFRVFRPQSSESASSGRLDILEFDLSTKTLAVTGTIQEVAGIAYSASPSGHRLLVREKSRLTLRDGRSGALIASLVELSPTRKGLGRFVSDGRIAIAVTDGSDVRVEVFSPDGSLERTLAIPARDRISLGGEAAPGKLLVAAGGDSSERASRTIFLIDLSSGEVRKVGDRLFPVVYLASWISNRPNYQPEPGSEATKLFFGPGRSLVRLNPLTGQRKVLLGRDTSR